MPDEGGFDNDAATYEEEEEYLDDPAVDEPVGEAERDELPLPAAARAAARACESFCPAVIDSPVVGLEDLAVPAARDLLEVGGRAFYRQRGTRASLFALLFCDCLLELIATSSIQFWQNSARTASAFGPRQASRQLG